MKKPIIIWLIITFALILIITYFYKQNWILPEKIQLSEYEENLWIDDIILDKIDKTTENIDNYKYTKATFIKTTKNFWIFEINNKWNTFETPLSSEIITKLNKFTKWDKLLLLKRNNSIFDVIEYESYKIKNVNLKELKQLIKWNVKNSFTLNWLTSNYVYNDDWFNIINELISFSSNTKDVLNYPNNNYNFIIYNWDGKIKHSINSLEEVSIVYFELKNNKTFIDFVKVNNLLTKKDYSIFNSYTLESKMIRSKEIKEKVYIKYKQWENWKNIFY